MADLFEGYRLGPGWDEMFAEPGLLRESYEALHATLQPLSSAELGVRAEALARALPGHGSTSALGVERPFPLDIVPRIIAAAEWRTVESGVAQRVRALEAFLADVYGSGQVIADGVVPRRVIATSAHFRRAAAGIDPPNGVRVHVAGIRLVRDERGAFRVLEDDVGIPSGAGHVIENRRAMTQVLPEVFAAAGIRPVESYPAMLLRALRAAAPVGVGDPTVVVLGPGVHDAAYAEHALLAGEMGVELVEGRDLVCAGNDVAVRTTAGEQRVDVVHRCVDDDLLDPVHFRADSAAGVAGLLNAARAGRVTIANAVGNGVAGDRLLYPYVPDLIRYYLDEEPLLANVDTYRLDEPGVLEHVLPRLDELVLQPVGGTGHTAVVIGSQASAAELEAAAAKIQADPRGWIARREVTPSSVPTLVGDRLRGRHVELRTLAVNDGERIRVLPGGLTRVALPENPLVVGSGPGGGSKDTWVLAEAGDMSPFGAPDRARESVAMLRRAAGSLYRIGRYVERAEVTARLLDLHLQRIHAQPWTDEDPVCRSLLTVMEVPAPAGRFTSARLFGLLGLDEHNPRSIVGALAAAREDARGTVPSETWECLDSTWRGLPAGAPDLLRWVRERCAAMVGVAEATMSRDEGWRFLVLGRSVERADLTARLLRSHERAGGSISSWQSLLRSCGGWETFLRAYRGLSDGRHAAEFLLLDRRFPRSVLAALSTAEECLSDLERGPGREGVPTDAQRIVGRARTDLEFRHPDEPIDDLAPLLASLERACSQVDEAVSRRYFRPTSAVTWIRGAVA